MLNGVQQSMGNHPFLAGYPGLRIGRTIRSGNVMGDAWWDALDPHLKT